MNELKEESEEIDILDVQLLNDYIGRYVTIGISGKKYNILKLDGIIKNIGKTFVEFKSNTTTSLIKFRDIRTIELRG